MKTNGRFVAGLIALAVTAAHGRAVAADGLMSNLITDPSAVFDVPQTPKSAYLHSITTTPFGTKLTRIANDPGTSLTTTAGAGVWGSDARHNYSKDQPWNADQSLIYIENRAPGSPTRLILDGATYQVKYPGCDNVNRGDDRWHPSLQHAHERINVSGSPGTELNWFDAVTCQKTRVWTLPFGVDYLGQTEGNPSLDGRFVALGDATRAFVVDMDPQPPFTPYPSRRIGPPRDISDCGQPTCVIDWVSISPSGRYAVVNYSGDFPRVLDVDPQTLALTPRPMPNGPYPNCIGPPANGFLYNVGHADMTLNPFDGNEDVIVGSDQCHNKGSTVAGQWIGGWVMVRLRDGAITALTDPTNEAYPHHASTRNNNRPGWVYVDYYPQPGTRFNDEVVAIKLDGSKSVGRFGQTVSAFSGCYRCEPHPVPSRDGTRVIFASNWALNCTSGCSLSPTQDYVVDARATLAPPRLISVSPVP